MAKFTRDITLKIPTDRGFCEIYIDRGFVVEVGDSGLFEARTHEGMIPIPEKQFEELVFKQIIIVDAPSQKSSPTA